MPRRKAKANLSLPEKWEMLSEAHEQAGALLRQIVVARLEAVQRDIDEIKEVQNQEAQGLLEPGETSLPRIWHTEIRSLGETLVRAIEIERTALTMELKDSNRAIQRVQQLGFLVTRDDNTIEVAAEYVADS